MNEHEFEMWSEEDCTVYVIQARIGDGQCDLWISSGGIRQDIYPTTVARHAATLWLQWVTQAA